jgi:hypothetical protein
MILINAECTNGTVHSPILRSAQAIEQEPASHTRLFIPMSFRYRMTWKGVDTTSMRPASDALYRRIGKRFSAELLANRWRRERLRGTGVQPHRVRSHTLLRF